MNYEIEVDGEKFHIEIIYHLKNQIKIVVSKNLEIKLYCRQNTAEGIIYSFILNKEKWIKKHISKFKNLNDIENVKFTDGSPFRYLGKEYTLRYINRADSYIDLYEDKIVLASPKIITKNISQKELTGWLTHKAREFFPEIIDNYLKVLSKENLMILQLIIRPMKSRWGTCNKNKKVVTLNSYLMQEPVPFIEYVVLHELCHLKHANHSNKFYSFLEQFMPDWQQRRKMRNRNIEEE